jgi:hypothetical protein
MALEEALGEALAGFEHGGGAGRTEDAEATVLEGIDNAEGERQLRADDGERGLLGEGDADEGVEVAQVDGDTAGDFGDAAVAGGADDFSDSIAALYRPGQRVLAASRTQDQDFHWRFPALPVFSMLPDAEKVI